MRRAAATGICILSLALAVLCSCPQDGAAPGDGADAGAEAAGSHDVRTERVDADAEEPWDPVWHLTEPKNWPTAGPEGQPDCGPGCRIALNAPVDHNTYYGHAFTAALVADVGAYSLAFASVGDSVTKILEGKGIIEPYLSGEHIVFLRATLPSSGLPGRVEVVSTKTGESKVVFSYLYSGAGDLGISITALNSKYAFWMREGTGFMSRNLATGEVRVLYAGSLLCSPICATENGVLCSDFNSGRIVAVDQESGSIGALQDGQALQVDMGCSAERAQVAWVDYRDPPGTSSDPDFKRSGGEIYMKDLDNNEVRRLTFDSPSSPRGKTYASIGDGLVVWREPPAGGDVNLSSAQVLYAAASTLVLLDLATNKKCRIDAPLVRAMTMSSIHGRHIYGYWGLPSQGIWLVDIDLDNPAIECKAYQ